MKKAGLLVVVLSLSLMSAACVQPVRYSAKDELFLRQRADMQPWQTIAVLPFSGEPAFRRVAAEWFAYQVHKQRILDILDPSLAEVELKQKGFSIGDADMTIDDAWKAGLLLGVDGVVVGSIKPQQVSPTQLGPLVAGASIIDTATGKLVATSVQSKVLVTMDMKEFAAAVTDEVVADLLPVLHSLAGRTWSPPPKREDRKPRGGQ